MAAEGRYGRAGGNVPEPGGAVGAPGEDLPAVRRGREREYRRLVALEGFLRPSALRVPRSFTVVALTACTAALTLASPARAGYTGGTITLAVDASEAPRKIFHSKLTIGRRVHQIN